MVFPRASAIVGAAAILAAVATPSLAQEKKKLTKDEMAQYEAIHSVVDAVVAGKQPAPADAKVTFHSDFLKSGSDIYIPYTLQMQPSFSGFPVVLYVRAVAKNPAAPAATKGDKGKVSGGTPSGASAFAFEDVYFIEPKTVPSTTGSEPPDAGKISRAMELMPGDYDVYFALSERPNKDKKAPPPKTVVYTQPLTVPDLLSGLTTSSVILAKNIEPAGAQLNGQQQLEQPYTVSGYKIIPSPVSSFPKTDELLWVFYIYNEGAGAGGKPDLNVEYNFFRAGEEKPFVNMPPSAYNATTLPGEFNLALGHMVFVAQGVPLTTFNPGEYKVQIKITDKTNNQSVTRDVPFSVTQ